MWSTILFDLDGTLTDSKEGLINAIILSLREFDIEVEDRDSLIPFIGPPLSDSYPRFYNFDDTQTAHAIKTFRDYYNVTGLYENALYDGAAALLEALHAQGKCLYVATSKPEQQALDIVKHFDIGKYFDFIGGAVSPNREHKDAVIGYVLDECRPEDLSQLVMVGDRRHDIEGAKKAGIASIGVSFGFGGREELEAAGADYVVDSMQELAALLGVQ